MNAQVTSAMATNASGKFWCCAFAQSRVVVAAKFSMLRKTPSKNPPVLMVGFLFKLKTQFAYFGTSHLFSRIKLARCICRLSAAEIASLAFIVVPIMAGQKKIARATFPPVTAFSESASFFSRCASENSFCICPQVKPVSPGLTTCVTVGEAQAASKTAANAAVRNFPVLNLDISTFMVLHPIKCFIFYNK